MQRDAPELFLILLLPVTTACSYQLYNFSWLILPLQRADRGPFRAGNDSAKQWFIQVV